MTDLMIASALGAALCLALGLLLARSRRLSPSDRHTLLCVACGAALLLPLLGRAMPARLAFPAARPSPTSVDEPVVRGSGEAASRAVAPGIAVQAAPPRPWRGPSLASVLLVLWIAGGAVCLLRLFLAHRTVRRVRGRARPFANGVRISPEVAAPMVCGIFRPTILLPESATAWTSEELGLALAHERAHIARHDIAKQWVASLACAVYWFLPHAWVVARRMASEREHAVDAHVLARGGRASSYAALLLRVATVSEGGLLTPFHAPSASRSALERRIEAILDTPPRARSRLALAAALASMGATACAIAACSAPPPAPPPTLAAARRAERTTPVRDGSTIDASRQAAAEALLVEWLAEEPLVRNARIVVMDVATRRIVIAAGRDRTSGPTTGFERAYPPGSTVKPLLVAAALDARVVEPSTVIAGEGGRLSLEASDGMKTLSDASPKEQMTLETLLAVSSNVGAVRIGQRLGARNVIEGFERAGLFQASPGTADVARPTAEGHAFHAAVVSIGHDMRVSPLALVGAYGALAGNGDVATPTLRDGEAPSAHRFVGDGTARTVRTMLEAVVSSEGTGGQARVPGVRVAGKTGTSDLADGAYYASFVGIVPADAPRWVVLVAADTTDPHASGGHTAAPRFARLYATALR